MDSRLKRAVGTGKCVVDCGCGSGQILEDLAGQFSQRIGLDFSRRRLNKLGDVRGRSWEFREADLNEALPLKTGSVDAVIANQVIEHIVDPTKFASEIYRVIRSEGRCVITTPNIRYLNNVAHILFSGYGPRTAGGNTIDGAWDDGHLHYFTHKDLREMFLEVGFRRVESSALIALDGAGYVRHILNRWGGIWPVREFCSGCILLWAKK